MAHFLTRHLFIACRRLLLYDSTTLAVNRSILHRSAGRLMSGHGRGKGGRHLLQVTIYAFPGEAVENKEKKASFRISGIHTVMGL